MSNEVIVRFDEVTFKYIDKKTVLDQVNFSVRRNSKITIMGQNGAGKSTIFKLLTGELKPQSGKISFPATAKVGIAQQTIAKDKLNLTLQEYLESAFPQKVYGIEKQIRDVLRSVKLDVPLDRQLHMLSGGQKARLLLAYALIQDPDILLLDEPTNNLDQSGIADLTNFLFNYPKTCIVISHDADFLNVFTDGVLNLDSHTHKVEQFVGNYYDVVEQIAAHIERQRLLNSRLEKSIADRFDKVNKLGGKSVAMRRLAVKVREDIEEDREKMVDVRREDKTLAEFEIPAQHIPRALLTINKVSFLKDHQPVERPVNIEMWRGQRLLISGPNGIGKSTLLKAILAGQGAQIDSDTRIGYYSQDFSELDFDDTALNSLKNVMLGSDMQLLYNTAGRFLLSGDLLQNTVGSLSEGQKGLLCYARFVLQQPGILIMDEPTNHINFRHIPVIAKALDSYKGALILVSHMPDFVAQMRTNQELDLTKL
jgi:ATPase subunit of ABC transporter with duplicated ATPase domains